MVRSMRQYLLRGLLILSMSVLGLLALAGNAAAQWEAVAFGSVCCIVMLIPIIIAILIAIWVYRDAESRGMSGVLWLLIVIFVPYFIGLIIYLVVRRDHPVGPPGGYPPPGYGGYPPPPGQYPPPPPPPPRGGY